MKSKVLFVFIMCCFAVSLSAQQITRFAVVDIARVSAAFFRDSRAVREFEERSAWVQSEIDRMTREIQELRSRNLDAVAQGNQELSQRLQNEIQRSSEFLREFHAVRTAELEEQRRSLSQSDSFWEQLHAEVRRVAESEGASLVLNLRENSGIIWFSPSVDITDKVIQNMLNRR